MTRKVLKKRRDRKRKTIKRHLSKGTKRRHNRFNMKKKGIKMTRRVHKKKYIGGSGKDIEDIRKLFEELFKRRLVVKLNNNDRIKIIENIKESFGKINERVDNLKLEPLNKVINYIENNEINDELKKTFNILIKYLIDKCDRSNFKENKKVNFGPVVKLSDEETYDKNELRKRKNDDDEEEREREIKRREDEVYGFGLDEPTTTLPEPKFIDDFYSRNVIYDLTEDKRKKKNLLILKQFYNNYTLIETTRDGNCFYNSYFQLAHRFKSNKNLHPFTPYVGQAKNNEIICTSDLVEAKWVDCFKEELAKRIFNNSDDELNEAFKTVFNRFLTLHVEEYIADPNKDQNEYMFQTILDSEPITDFNPIYDTPMIEVFTKELPNLLNANRPVIDVLIEELKLIDKDMIEQHKEMKKEKTVTEFITTKYGNSEFENKIKSKIFSSFIKAFTDKLKVRFGFATSIEIGIIQTFINLKYDKDIKKNKNNPHNMIPIINMLGPHSFNSTMMKNYLDNSKMERQFIFYKNGNSGQHYDAVFSEAAAPAIPGSPEDKIFQGPKVERPSSARATSSSRGTASPSRGTATTKEESYGFKEGEDIDPSLFEYTN